METAALHCRCQEGTSLLANSGGVRAISELGLVGAWEKGLIVPNQRSYEAGKKAGGAQQEAEAMRLAWGFLSVRCSWYTWGQEAFQKEFRSLKRQVAVGSSRVHQHRSRCWHLCFAAFCGRWMETKVQIILKGETTKGENWTRCQLYVLSQSPS